MSTKKKSKPDWLKELNKKLSLVEVINMAYDEECTDKEVRVALLECAEDMGDSFVPPSSIPRK